FEYMYRKNFNNTNVSYSLQSLKEYLELFINFKLKVAQAYENKIDLSPSFQREFSAYQKQLARPYLTDKNYSEKILQETYQRMTEEIKASHILVMVSENAPAKDTLAAFQKISSLRNRIVKNGEDFNQLAAEYSEDPSAKTNRGNLGYFTALQMVYPFETAAYQTKVGEVSPIIRTKFGYHILKVHDRRPFSGYITAAHIMLRANEGMNPEDIAEAERKIHHIKEQLAKGENWDVLCRQFSEDFYTKETGGVLPEFVIGQLPESFAEAALRFNNPGEISDVVRTPFGFHLIKLIEKKPLPPYEKIINELKEQLIKDERSEVPQKLFIEKLKKENHFKENFANKEYALTLLTKDSSLLKGEWKPLVEKKPRPLFTLGSKTYSTADFFAYVEQEQKAQPQELSVAEFANLLYQQYVNKTVLAYEESLLPIKYENYKNLLKEYKEGLMLFQIMEDSVWNLASSNEEALKQFFEANQEKYHWKERAAVTIYNCSHDSVFQVVKSFLDTQRFLLKSINPQEISFEKNQTMLTAEMKKPLEKTIELLQKNPDFLLSVQVVSLPHEKKSTSSQRLQEIKQYLLKNGIQEQQLILSQIETTKGQVSRKKGGWLVCQLWGTTIHSLQSELNRENALNLQIIQGKYEKSDNRLLEKIRWEKGRYELSEDNRRQLIIVEEILPSQPKTFAEAKGSLISDYQSYIEKRWLERLKKKYPVTVNEAVLHSLVKEN
ncbi:MAG: peptidylprolyl isomerase, partial [Flammeovirgaceae bacterium]|nr:peptidylprolyl isomerase [Flammeovirgaceae bacterium]MDW8286589.1 peptidylprolyl isomerase [Flammeovirgaceae bacterium]